MDMITLAMAKAYSDSKGGYTEPGKVLRTATLSLEDEIGIAEFESPIPLEEGKTYTVTTDSGSYTVVCKRYYEDGMAHPLFWVGDNPEAGEEITHGFYYGESEGGTTNVAIDFNGGTTFSISPPETIHPIDPKYLPGVCLPVVELNIDALIGEEVAFTDAENAALTACIGMPFILKSGNSTVSTSMVMEYNGGGNEHMFSNSNTTLYTNNGGETWKVIIE